MTGTRRTMLLQALALAGWLAAGLAGGAAGAQEAPGAAVTPAAEAPAPDAAPTLTLLFAIGVVQVEPSPSVASVPQLAAFVARERAEGRPVLFLHGGNSVVGNWLSALDRGRHMVALLNLLGTDAMSLGHWEFAGGLEALRARAAEARFPLVATTVRDAATGRPPEGVVASVMLEAGGVKVGVLSATHPDLFRLVMPTTGLAFADPVEAVGEAAAALRRDGADLVVLATPVAGGQNARLAEAGAADILLHYDSRGIDLPVHRRTAKGLEIGLAQRSSYGVAIDIRAARGEGGAFTWTPAVRAVDLTVEVPDAAAMAHVDALVESRRAELDAPVVRLMDAMDTRTRQVRTRENGFANLVADALRERLRADAALIGSGAIRGTRLYPADTVMTRRDLLVELPLGNAAVLIEVTGAQLRAALEHAVADPKVATGRFPQVSGMRLSFDLSRPPGSRLTSAEVAGRTLDDAASYRLATMDFLAGGGDGHAALAQGRPLAVDGAGQPVEAIVRDFLAARRQVVPAVDGRIAVAGGGR